MKAALVLVDLDTGDSMVEVLEGANPMLEAVRLLAAVRTDWPGYRSAIIGDEQAHAAYRAAKVLPLFPGGEAQ